MLQHVSHHRRALSLLTGSGLVIAGVAVVVAPLIGVVQRGRADDNALSQWRSGGSGALMGSAPDARDHPGGCGSATPTDSYALVSFPTLSRYGYAGVAGDQAATCAVRASAYGESAQRFARKRFCAGAGREFQPEPKTIVEIGRPLSPQQQEQEEREQ